MTHPLADDRPDASGRTAPAGPRPRRILLVTPVSPANISSGSGQRTALMLEALESCGAVDVVHLMPGAVSKVGMAAPNPALASGGRMVEAVAPEKALIGRYRSQPALTRAIESHLGHALSDYDVIVGRYAWGICQLDIPTGVRVIADLDDFKYRYGPQAPLTVETLKERLRKWVAHRLMRRQLHRFDSVFFVSPLDQREQPQVQSVLLPNIPFMVPPISSSPATVTKSVLFVGSLWYRPNAEGVDWLLRHVWPQVRREVSDATLTLVGAAPPATRQAWAAHPGVRAPGFVDDLAHAYAEASLVVVPIHSGGGTNIKVLEAMAYSRPCLISQFTHAGFGAVLVDSENILVAGDSKQFAAAVVDVLRKPEKYISMARSGRGAISEKFNSAIFKSLIQEAVI